MSATRMYDVVTVLPSSALSGFPSAKFEVRPRRLGATIAGSVAALIAIAAGMALFSGGAGRSWLVPIIALWIGGFATLFAWLSLHHARSAGGRGGWVLREDGAHLLVNLRSHLNTHFDPETPSVLVLPRRRVRSLRVVHERGVRTHVADDGGVQENPIRREFLDIALDRDAGAVSAALEAESRRPAKALLGSYRYRHSAVRLLPDGVLRIAWRDETNRLYPALSVVGRYLRQYYRFAEEGHSEQAPLRALDAGDLETRLLEMAVRGERMEAIKLAKTLYGMNTSDAVRFVDELRH